MPEQAMNRWTMSWENVASAGLFLVSVASLSLGNVLLKLGMDRWGEASSPWGWAGVPIVGGVFLLAVQFVGMLTLFRLGWPVSVVVPVFGLNFAVTALLGGVLLREEIDGFRWLGIALVIAGIVFISAPWVARKPL